MDVDTNTDDEEMDYDDSDDAAKFEEQEAAASAENKDELAENTSLPIRAASENAIADPSNPRLPYLL
ncbi:hypothetical protein PtrSN002B_008456 [Pyrenophora tritici-repentis]|nr:hypothetical protein PtrV1_01251 [Pyrenophora tritici-repentis]KAI1529002.1 hypothetical protein PtrSN001A_008758 [Pyrenophora tritici-repentis]KAI1532433.1 hypothetical protein PtrSN001C_007970 [Pyrenophora tritici-repentis]KAI1541282.1 hypothetical protein PtrSN002B_008456 [Pyrenophora tritici-repentis]KAI1565120.1 hypothetical protein PtrEW4_008399 [Pyrenophora tritici-repentis]